MKEVKKLGLVRVLNLIKSGLSPAQISKKYLIPKQTLSYSVGKLKRMGCIEKVGYGTWRYIRSIKEVPIITTTHSDRQGEKEIRGHAFIWRIVFYNPYNWEKIIKSYQKKNLTFQRISSGKVLRTIFKHRKIWLSAKGMTIYEPLDFMGRSSHETKGRAVFEMDLLIKDLLRELGQKFKPYKFTTSREHYGIVKHGLARQYNDKKEKMEIKSEDGNIWMWIDDSKGLGELENNEAVVNRQVQQYWNNHKKHNFEVDASFVLNGFDKQNKMIGQNSQNLNNYAKHLTSHVASVQELGKAVKILAEKVGKMRGK